MQRGRFRAAENFPQQENRHRAGGGGELSGGGEPYHGGIAARFVDLAILSADLVAVCCVGRAAAFGVRDYGAGGAAGRDCEIGCGTALIIVSAGGCVFPDFQ